MAEILCIKAVRSIPRRMAASFRNYLLNVHSKVVGAKPSRLPDVARTPGARVCVFGHPRHFAPDGRKDTLRILCGTDNLYSVSRLLNLFFCDYTILHYLRDDNSLPKQIIALLCSITGIQKLYFVEPSFLSSVLGYTADTAYALEYRQISSYFIDDMSFYFDSTAGSRVEQFLNSEESILDDDAKKSCAMLIRDIIEKRLTKYNFQPEEALPILDRTGPKVLVVDQTEADASVWRAYGGSDSFKRMLRDALFENPDATVYIKTHPDKHLNARGCYYENLCLPPEDMERVRIIDVPANPYTIIEAIDIVYVCTSQLGFEALMAGKRVKTYGMPVYAGWGLTDDKVSCERRRHKRSLEELFHALYVRFAVHIDLDRKRQCDVKSHIEQIARLAARYRSQ